MTLEQVVVETGCEGLEQVDRVVEARLEWWRIEARSAWSEVAVVEVEVVRLLVGRLGLKNVWVVTRVLFLAEKEVAFDDANVSGNLHNDAGFHGDCGSVHGSDCLHDSSVDLHDGVRSVQVSVNDDGFYHNADENEENDEVGSNMTVSDDDDGIHSVRIFDDSHICGNQRVNGDDKSGDQSDDGDIQDRRVRGECFQ